MSDENSSDALVTRMREVFEQIDGHNNEIQRRAAATARHRLLDRLGRLDTQFGLVDPSSHVIEDLFRSKSRLLPFFETCR